MVFLMGVPHGCSSWVCLWAALGSGLVCGACGGAGQSGVFWLVPLVLLGGCRSFFCATALLELFAFIFVSRGGYGWWDGSLGHSFASCIFFDTFCLSDVILGLIRTTHLPTC